MQGWNPISLCQDFKEFAPDIVRDFTMVAWNEQQDEGSGLELVHLSDVLDALGQSISSQ